MVEPSPVRFRPVVRVGLILSLRRGVDRRPGGYRHAVLREEGMEDAACKIIIDSLVSCKVSKITSGNY